MGLELAFIPLSIAWGFVIYLALTYKPPTIEINIELTVANQRTSEGSK